MPQDQACPFTRLMSSFNDKVQTVEEVDSLVNYGLVTMIPLLLLATLL